MKQKLVLVCTILISVLLLSSPAYGQVMDNMNDEQFTTHTLVISDCNEDQTKDVTFTLGDAVPGDNQTVSFIWAYGIYAESVTYSEGPTAYTDHGTYTTGPHSVPNLSLIHI